MEMGFVCVPMAFIAVKQRGFVEMECFLSAPCLVRQRWDEVLDAFIVLYMMYAHFDGVHIDIYISGGVRERVGDVHIFCCIVE